VLCCSCVGPKEPSSGNDPDVDIGAHSRVLDRSSPSLEFGEGRDGFYVVAFPRVSIASALDLYHLYPMDAHPGLSLGVLALSKRSPHFGLRLGWCDVGVVRGPSPW